MKLRSISLTNVRRFAGTTACLDGLGDGLNLVAAPNEAGKSTFFEALQALLFVPARSGGAEARGLRPYAGGAPEVAAEVELGGIRYRIAKRWLSRPSARVTELPSGRVLAQDDEAEAWIAGRVAGDGPAELLWVRQGMLALEPDGRNPSEKAEQDRLAKIRRDLLSSVASELAAITGGQRLDAIAARCEADLAKIATATGRSRKDGPWGVAVHEAATLRDDLSRLDRQCDELAAALAERVEVRDALARAGDPAAARALADALAEAERAAVAARLHQSRLEAARGAHRATALERDAAAAALADHDRMTGRASKAAADADAARHASQEAGEARAAAAEREAAATEAAAAARAAHAAALRALDAAQRAARGNAAAARAAAQGARLARAAALAGEIEAAAAEAGAAAVSAADVDAARAAAAELDRARARLEAGAVTVAVAYLPGVAQRVTLDGRPVEPGVALACAGVTTLDLPGLGRLTLAPGGDAAGPPGCRRGGSDAAGHPRARRRGRPRRAGRHRRAVRRRRGEGRARRRRDRRPRAAGDRGAGGRDRPRRGRGRRRRPRRRRAGRGRRSGSRGPRDAGGGGGSPDGGARGASRRRPRRHGGAGEACGRRADTRRRRGGGRRARRPRRSRGAARRAA